MGHDDDITCQQFIRTLADYLAGELGQSDVNRSELHLAVCADCVRYLKDYEITIRLGREASAGKDALPPELADVILSARRRR